MRRTLMVVVAAGLLCAAAQSAAPPPIEERFKNLAEQIKQAQKKKAFEEAERLAGQVLALHERWEGKQYWQTIDARLQLERWRRLRAVPAPKRADVVSAMEATTSGDEESAKGHYTQAEKKHREALELYRKVLGEEHAETATGYYNLAESLEAQSKYDDAMLLHKKSLEIRGKILGEEHSATATSLDGVGGILYFQNKRTEAQPLLEKALGIYLRTLGQDHPITADSYNHVAGNLNSQGKYALAQPLYEKALAIRRKVRGDHHTKTADGCNEVAYCLYSQGKYAEAQPLFEEALAIYRKRLTENHPYTGTCYSNVAMNLSRQHKHAQAEPLFGTALDILMKTLGPKYRNTAGAMNNLATNLDAQGKHAQAQPYYEQSRTILTNLLGKEDPTTAIAISNLAGNLQLQSKDTEARVLYDEALAIFKKKLGEKDPITAEFYHRLAMSLDRESEPARVQELLEKALAIRQAVLVEDHPTIAANFHDLAGVLAAQGKLDEAKRLLQKALAIRKKMLGAEHPETASSDTALAALLWRQGEKEKAVPYWQAACRAYAIARIDRAAGGFDRSLAQGRGLSPDVALAAALAGQGKPEAAFVHAESNLARGLLDSLGPGVIKDDQDRVRVRNEKEKLDQKLIPLLGRSKLTPEDQRQRDELLARRSELVAQLSRQAAAASERLLLSLARIQRQIPADGAIVLWIDADPIKEHWGCVLRASGPPHWLRLPGTGKGGTWRKADTSLPTRLLEVLSDPRSNPAELRRRIAAVRKQRLDPLRPHLEEVRRLFVVPVSPMEALPVEVLGEEYRISYVPSASLYARAMEQHRPLRGDSLLALGDPVFDVAAPNEKNSLVARRNLGQARCPAPGRKSRSWRGWYLPPSCLAAMPASRNWSSSLTRGS